MAAHKVDHRRGKKSTPVLVRMNRRMASHLPTSCNACWEWPGATSRGGYGQISGPNREILYTHPLGEHVEGTKRRCLICRRAYEANR